MVDIDADKNYVNVLKTLDSLSSTELRIRYHEVLGQSPPSKTSIHFLKGQIAWTLQARQRGEDPGILRQSILHRLKISRQQSKAHYKPGTRLVREWQGRVYEVTVMDEGYEYDGALYRSLSPIANQITGSHCSGPRFFGIKIPK